MDNKLCIGRLNDILFIRIHGEMRAGNTFSLNDFLAKYIEEKGGALSIIMDMSECKYMDSTFIGFIISLEKKCEKHLLETFAIVNPSVESKSALKKLYALEKLKVENNFPLPDIPVCELISEESSFSDIKNLRLVFEAHEELSSLSKENQREFQALLDGLRAEIYR